MLLSNILRVYREGDSDVVPGACKDADVRASELAEKTLGKVKAGVRAARALNRSISNQQACFDLSKRITLSTILALRVFPLTVIRISRPQ